VRDDQLAQGHELLPVPDANDLGVLAALELHRRKGRVPRHFQANLRIGQAALGPEPPWVTVTPSATGASFVAVEFFRDEPWLVRGHLLQTEHGFVVSRLAVERFLFTDTSYGARLDPGTNDVTGTVIRGLHPDKIRERALLMLQHKGTAYQGMERAGWDLAPEEFDQVRRLAEAARELPLNRGRKGYPDDHYRRIALAYIDDVRAHGSRGVLARLASAENVSRATIRDWVRRARELGFLAPTKQGRAEATPGPNLHRPEAY
jgi:hypothetical protein